MNKNKLLISFLAIAIIFGVYFFVKGKDAEVVIVDKNGSYEECIKEGNLVMESYPRQCRYKDGRVVMEVIDNSPMTGKENLIRVTSPLPNSTISSPLVITGTARGYWFFEASFPVYLTDWDGKIIAEGFATAQDDWMTTEFVPFKATLTYKTSDISGQYSNRGTLILKKDNPSGLPENDDALEFQVLLK